MTKGHSRRDKALKPRVGRRLWISVSLAIVAASGAWIFAGLIGCGGSIIAVGPSPAVPVSTVSPIPGSPIQHIVIIMQENRSFDNLFNGYPGADTVQGGMNGDQLVPLKAVSLGDSRDLSHSHKRWMEDWDHGQMDGFAQNGSLLPYSYVPRSDVEEYWSLAQNYVLGDHMFQSNTGPSFVAHQYMIAGQSGNVA